MPPPAAWFRWRHLWFTLVPGVLWFVLGNELAVCPWGMARIRAVAGHADIPDLHFFYGPDQAYGLIAALGDEGRAVYGRMLWILDGVYPPLYGLGLAVVIGCLSAGRWRWLALLPLAAAAADLAENVCIQGMLTSFPAHAGWAEGLAGWCTAAKWSLLATTLLVIAIAAGLRRK